jgi:hypothetical protein
MDLSNYLRSLLRCLLVAPSYDTQLLEEEDRNNLAAGDLIVTALSPNGTRHTFLTMRGWEQAQG